MSSASSASASQVSSMLDMSGDDNFGTIPTTSVAPGLSPWWIIGGAAVLLVVAWWFWKRK